MLVDQLKNRIRDFRREEGLSKSELARRAGLSGDTVLRGMDDDDWNPTARTLDALLAVVDQRSAA